MLRALARGEGGSPVNVMNPSKADVDYVIKGIGNGLRPRMIWSARRTSRLSYGFYPNPCRRGCTSRISGAAPRP